MSTYQIDPVHSHLQFAVRHLMVSNVRGSFSGVKGTVSYDPANPSATTLEAVIDVNTVNTNDEKRDGHLKTADFFDTALYPEITFKSTHVEKEDESDYKVTGDLTMHGVTKPVVLTVTDVSPEGKDPWGGTRIGCTAKTKIKRSDFGLNWNAALETGGFVISDDVRIEFELEFVKV
jgi:polyisoprenoid-binding protein YceI